MLQISELRLFNVLLGVTARDVYEYVYAQFVFGSARCTDRWVLFTCI